MPRNKRPQPTHLHAEVHVPVAGDFFGHEQQTTNGSRERCGHAAGHTGGHEIPPIAHVAKELHPGGPLFQPGREVGDLRHEGANHAAHVDHGAFGTDGEARPHGERARQELVLQDRDGERFWNDHA